MRRLSFGFAYLGSATRFISRSVSATCSGGMIWTRPLSESNPLSHAMPSASQNGWCRGTVSGTVDK